MKPNFCRSEFGVEMPDSVSRALFTAQSAVMPRLHREYPRHEHLEHDIVGYFRQFKAVACLDRLEGHLTRLADFAPGEILVTPATKRRASIRFTRTYAHSDEWELPSELQFY
jgi:hypothetical protein